MRTVKEYNRVFWITKGHLIPDNWRNETVLDMYGDYFRRMWYNTECYQWEAGFEEAYKEKYG